MIRRYFSLLFQSVGGIGGNLYSMIPCLAKFAPGRKSARLEIPPEHVSAHVRAGVEL